MSYIFYTVGAKALIFNFSLHTKVGQFNLFNKCVTPKGNASPLNMDCYPNCLGHCLDNVHDHFGLSCGFCG